MPAPEVLRTVDDFRRAAEQLRSGAGSLGLVPTMGALHDGHSALMREARRRATATAVTIFVNPAQFGPKEDLARYPRDLAGDVDRCAAEGVSIVFAPDVSEMYPAGERTRVRVGGLTDYLCGASRPGHFEGVATIVTKLFAVAGRSVAVFGRKDYQQLQVIRRITRDLLLPVEIVGHPTVRERDGLALSSRNAYLGAEDRARAIRIPQVLSESLERFRSGEQRVRDLREPVRAALEDAGLRVDYVAIADADDLTPLDEGALVGSRALLAVAVFAGNTRLIDNVVYGEDALPLDPVASAPIPAI